MYQILRSVVIFCHLSLILDFFIETSSSSSSFRFGSVRFNNIHFCSVDIIIILDRNLFHFMTFGWEHEKKMRISKQTKSIQKIRHLPPPLHIHTYKSSFLITCASITFAKSINRREKNEKNVLQQIFKYHKREKKKKCIKFFKLKTECGGDVVYL